MPQRDLDLHSTSTFALQALEPAGYLIGAAIALRTGFRRFGKGRHHARPLADGTPVGLVASGAIAETAYDEGVRRSNMSRPSAGLASGDGG